MIVVNYGNYHLARARALSRVEDLEPSFIELVAGVKRSPWWNGDRDVDKRVITLMDSSYEDGPMREISRKLVALLSELQPDVVAIAGYRDLPMRTAARWARRNSRGVVLFSETTQWDIRRRWWQEVIKRIWIQRHVDAAVVGGKPHRSYAVKLGVDPDRIWDRYDVVDNDYFSGGCDALRVESSAGRTRAGLPANYFLYVGRLAPEKNLVTLLRAYRRYREAHSQAWSLVIVGDGPQRHDLLHVEREEGIQGIIWTGSKQADDLPLYYGFAGCFILPSMMEPWGLVVNEALASGLPVIVSQRCGSASDLVQHGRNGFVFDPNDTGQLGELMYRVATASPEQRGAMGHASKEIISAWSPEQWARQVASAVRVAALRRQPARAAQ